MNENFPKKSLTMPKKTERGDALVSPGMVFYAEKEEKPFWFSSLGQMIQLGTIKFCRTFKNYFGQFVWIEKKVTIIVAFHFMKRRLKMTFQGTLQSNPSIRLPSSIRLYQICENFKLFQFVI